MSRRSIPKSIREAVIARDKRVCNYCGKSGLYKTNLQLDHKLPVTRGGEDTLDNLMVSCKVCNRLKGSKTVQEYLDYKIPKVEQELNSLKNLLK